MILESFNSKKRLENKVKILLYSVFLDSSYTQIYTENVAPFKTEVNITQQKLLDWIIINSRRGFKF